MEMRLRLLLRVLMSLGFGGCSTYVASPASLPTPQAMPVSQVLGSVEVGVDPYRETERQAAVFCADLTKAEVVAIQLLLTNRGTHAVVINRADIRLVLADRSEIKPASKTQVVDTVALKAAGIFPPAAGIGTFVAFVDFALVRGLGGQFVELQDRSNRLRELRNKELKDVMLEKDTSVHGFVYFILPKASQALELATVTVPVVNPDEEVRYSFSLPLKTQMPLRN